MSELELRKGKTTKPALVGAGVGSALTAALFILGPIFTLLVLLGLGAGVIWKVFSA